MCESASNLFGITRICQSSFAGIRKMSVFFNSFPGQKTQEDKTSGKSVGIVGFAANCSGRFERFGAIKTQCFEIGFWRNCDIVFLMSFGKQLKNQLKNCRPKTKGRN